MDGGIRLLVYAKLFPNKSFIDKELWKLLIRDEIKALFSVNTCIVKLND